MKRRDVIGATASIASLAGCVFADRKVEYERGEIEVVVDGTAVDLSADRYQSENAADDSIRFHLHERDDYWYMEGDPVTFAEGIDLLPHFEYTQQAGAHVVTIDGTVYDGRDSDTEIIFSVDGDPVDPNGYVPEHGDELRLRITTGD
ncbi:hypothetical protein [Halopiger djelfimassiliensis]|uniref:hypothetical protein n=1 Tax=Halopiger djelfimassiliensis TaxID=1293047 RepID=UPI000678073E|nr:hypothetical protein [Halopiger djelfimassiliensis]